LLLEVTPLKGPSGDVQHCANRIIAQRGVRYSRMAMIPASAQAKRRPKAYLTIETPVVARTFRAKLGTLSARRCLALFPQEQTLVLKHYAHRILESVDPK